jgi:hypothetical protein
MNKKGALVVVSVEAGCFPFVVVGFGSGGVGLVLDWLVCCLRVGGRGTRDSCAYKETVLAVKAMFASTLTRLPGVLVES